MSRWVVLVVVLGGCVQRSAPAVSYSYVEVTVGDGFSCANRLGGNGDSEFVCWGRDVAATHPPLESLGPTMIHMAGLHGCGTTGERGVVCWGEPGDPVVSVPQVTAPDVLVSSTHACVLNVATIPRCWGQQSAANGPGGNAFVIEPGVGHTCMLEFASHMPICWGDNTMGQATPPATSFQQLALGDGFSCALPLAPDPIQGAAVTCWGRSLPNMPPPTARFRGILAGPTYACGVGAGTGLVTCWGDGSESLLTPPPVAFYELALGRDHACGITDAEDSELVCWGDNTFGQLDVPKLPKLN